MLARVQDGWNAILSGKLPILHRAKLELSHSIFSAGIGLARLKFANISMNFGRSTSLILYEETT
jgi:hypothetical protein